MKLRIQQLMPGNALRIANEWRYPGEYSFYNMNQNQDNYAEFISSQERGNHYWQVTVSGVLIGFFEVKPTNKRGNYELKFGMVPASTGQGYGQSFVETVIDFVRAHFHVSELRMNIAKFNIRAQRVSLALGFTITRHYQQQTNGHNSQFVEMKRQF